MKSQFKKHCIKYKKLTLYMITMPQSRCTNTGITINMYFDILLTYLLRSWTLRLSNFNFFQDYRYRKFKIDKKVIKKWYLSYQTDRVQRIYFHQPTEDFGNHCLRSSYPLFLQLVNVCPTLNGHQMSINLGYSRSYTFLKNMDKSNTNLYK